MILKEITEDGVDLTIRELLEHDGWKTAYYSPPCGSWSIINFEIGGAIFRSFSPRDISRPDLVLYKENKDSLDVILIESKEKISSFAEEDLNNYITTMKDYLARIMTMEYRHKKESGKWFDWNNEITNIKNLKINHLILFIAGSNPTNYDDEFKIMEKMSRRFRENEEDIGFSMVSIDFKNLKNKINFIYNHNNFLSEKFNKELSLDYLTLQK